MKTISHCQNQKLNPLFNIQANKNLWLSVQWIILTLIFALAYTQSPLYTSSQNTYFLHGLAKGGLGFLQHDWLAQTIDPTPVFSLLVTFTFSQLHEIFFYCYHTILLGIYLYSILNIVSLNYQISDSKLKFLIYFLLITALHSALLNPSVPFSHQPLLWFLQAGIAKQEVLGYVFQPSMTGVFIFLSIYVFLRGQHFRAILLSTLAATLHPTYVLTAAVLTLSYLIVLLQDRQIKKAILLGFLALGLILPIVSYVFLSFRPTSPEIFVEAQTILVDYRMYPHTKPWLGEIALIQFIIMILGLYLTRKKQIFTIFAVLFIATISLTSLQLVIQNKTLALLFPWRITVFLVPMASCFIVAYLVSLGFEVFNSVILKSKKLIYSVVLTLIFILPLYGIKMIISNGSQVIHSKLTPMMDFVAMTKQPQHLYLIPTNERQLGGPFQNFRLYTGARTFIDTRSHPYKDIEIVEWYKKVKLASQFYQAKEKSACRRLEALSFQYHLTHVVFDNNNIKENCDILRKKLYQDNHFTIYALKSRSAKNKT